MRLRHESSLRKTLSFAVIHLAIAVALGWLFTGAFVPDARATPIGRLPAQ